MTCVCCEKKIQAIRPQVVYNLSEKNKIKLKKKRLEVGERLYPRRNTDKKPDITEDETEGFSIKKRGGGGGFYIFLRKPTAWQRLISD